MSLNGELSMVRNKKISNITDYSGKNIVLTYYKDQHENVLPEIANKLRVDVCQFG